MTDSTLVQNLIIGSGQAGNPLAGWLAKDGQTVALIERDRVGGSCVNYGCTPTKTMVASARVAYMARRAAEYGVEVGDVSVDLQVVRERKRAIVDQWSSGSEKGLRRHDTLELIFGEASFSGPREVTVALRDGGARTLTADRVFINTGTRNFVPPIDGLDEVDYLTNESLMELAEVPEHLLVLGGGYIGFEFGQMFRRFGAEVTVMEAADRFLRREDEDVVDAIVEKLRTDGMTLLASARAKRVQVGPDGAGVTVTLDTADGEKQIHGSHLLVAVGRTPNTEMLNLSAAGIDATDRGYITVNERLETSAENVWAIGDCKGGPAFTHISYHDAVIVRKRLLEGRDNTIADRIVPYTMFIDPQLGRVGMTEQDARAAGHNVKIATIPMTRVARAAETSETTGLMKAVIDADTDRIIGATVFGLEGGEVATVIQMAMAGNLPYTAVRDMAIAHPLVSESLNNLFSAVK